MITYNDAIVILTNNLAPSWDVGTFYVDPNGYEDAESFLLPYGPKEWLVDDNEEFLLMDLDVAIVNKTTGALEFINYLSNADYIEAFTNI